MTAFCETRIYPRRALVCVHGPAIGRFYILSRSDRGAFRKTQKSWGGDVGDVAFVVPDDTPEDVATLYSWANIHGARYRDFSSDRAQVREQARKRVEEAMEMDRLRSEEAASAQGRIHAEGVLETPFDAPAPLAGTNAVSAPAQISANPAPQTDAAAASQTVAGSISARWFALHSIFPSNSAEPARERARIPALAVFSMAGGVGKTSLVATLGRALSSCGERVLLVDTAAFGMLPFYFGARDQRHGILRTFVAPDARGEARIEILALDIDRFGPESNAPEPFTQEILRHAGNSGRILIDLATASGDIVRRILRMSPTVLVPVLPDTASVASVSAIEQFFLRNPDGAGQAIAPYYVLNQFDEGQRLHRDVRNILHRQLGERLLPFELSRTSAVNESLAEGMTVMDYSIDLPVVDQYARLAEWVRDLVAPSEPAWRGTRWSER